MIKKYKNKVTGIKAVFDGRSSFKVIDVTEEDDTCNIVMMLSASDIKNSKYWEIDMEEPEGVEVLSLTNKYAPSGLWIRTDKGFTWNTWKSDDTFYSVKDLLINDGINKIYSVKRLSDGVVFTVGDITTNGIIESFELATLSNPWRGGLGVRYSRNIDGRTSTVRAEAITEVKLEPKRIVEFVSEDGVDMYAGDKYYFINLFDKTRTCEATVGNYGGRQYKDNTPRFSTREACQAVIDKRDNYDILTKDGVKSKIGDKLYWVFDDNTSIRYLYPLSIHKAHIKDKKIWDNNYKVFSTLDAANAYIEEESKKIVEVKLTRGEVEKIKELNIHTK